MARSFEEEWRNRIELVRSSGFWRQISRAPKGRIVPKGSRASPDAVLGAIARRGFGAHTAPAVRRAW